MTRSAEQATLKAKAQQAKTDTAVAVYMAALRGRGAMAAEVGAALGVTQGIATYSLRRLADRGIVEKTMQRVTAPGRGHDLVPEYRIAGAPRQDLGDYPEWLAGVRLPERYQRRLITRWPDETGADQGAFIAIEIEGID